MTNEQIEKAIKAINELDLSVPDPGHYRNVYPYNTEEWQESERNRRVKGYLVDVLTAMKELDKEK